MSETPAISVRGVSKSFRLPHENHSGLKQKILSVGKGKKGYETQEVLKDISFDIQKGEFFGIVGRNGSGKSTLLKLISGIYSPNEGKIDINGILTPFIELGVGFNPELTGRENVFLNGALLGFSRQEMLDMYDEIVEFAELERFMDQKLKNYSSGMQVRLAFSIAIRANSDILVLDEVLAVGDASFQKKCYDYFTSLKQQQKTVVLVTHDMNAVKMYCDNAIMIEDGKIVERGTPEEISQAYQKLFNNRENEQSSFIDKNTPGDRWGEGGIVSERAEIDIAQDYLTLTVTYLVDADKPKPVYGFTLYNANKINILEGNTLRSDYKTKPVRKGEKIVITWKIPNILATGQYKISTACCDISTTHFYDWLNDAIIFSVTKDSHTAGMVSPPLEIIKYEQRAN